MTEENLEQRLERKRKELSSNTNITYNNKHKDITDKYIFQKGEHNIDYNILVKDGGTLIIEAGAILNFWEGTGIYVHQGKWKSGRICIFGDQNESAVLQPKNETWDGITINNSNRDNIISYSTIRGASKKEGGGIYTQNSRLNIADTIIEQCNAEINGGGIYNNKSKIKINNTTLKENRACHGGGIYNKESKISMDNISVIDNYAKLCGAGICNTHSENVIKNSHIMKNIVEQNGGGIHNFYSNTSIEGTEITDNNANEGAGMFLMGDSKVKAVNISLERNTAEYGGGIILTDKSRFNVTDSLLKGNHAKKNGGGICNHDTAIVNLNNTLITNNIAENGGGIYNSGIKSTDNPDNGSRITIDNTTIIKNVARGGKGGGIYNSYGKIKNYSNNIKSVFINIESPNMTISLMNKNTIENNSPDNIFSFDQDD